MSVEEAQRAFFDIYTAVFANENSSPETRAISLEKELGNLMRSRGVPLNTRMNDPVITNASQVALCYSSASRLDHCSFFRNYQSPQQLTPDVTIIEAIRASWATPGLVQPSRLGPKGYEQDIISASNGFVNPTQEVLKEAYDIFGSTARISCILNLGSGHRGVVSLSGDDLGISSIAIRLSIDPDAVAEDLYRRYARLGVYYRLSVDRGLEGWNRLESGFGIIRAHSSAYIAKSEPSNILDRCISASISEGRMSMDRLVGLRTQGLRSAYGLPLSAYFVKRKRPMDVIINGLVERHGYGQRIMVISGLGGSGKTQLTLKFARDFQESYRHILFIDASSSASIQKGFVSRVRSIKPNNIPITVEEAIEILENPDEKVTEDWLIIFDNADNLEEPLSKYIPSCDHGSILITSRDAALGELSPKFHLTLGSMDEEEAVEVLLSAAFPIGETSLYGSQLQSIEVHSTPTRRDREAAAVIAKELGCLPIAVVQAGCYIKQHKALHQYLEQLKTNRSDLLKRATRVHLDKLKYPHGVYASFDIVLNALSTRAVHLLNVLSFFHFSDFPRPLFGLGAKSQFTHEYSVILDRLANFGEAVQLLMDVICPGGSWRENDLNQLLEEFQRYSLVSLVSSEVIIFLRFHPLVHVWSQDRMSPEGYDKYRAAAVRLLVSGIIEGNDLGLFEHLLSHATSFITFFDSLHANDKAAISWLLYRHREPEKHLKTWRDIYDGVESTYGTKNARTTRAALDLADAYGGNGDRRKMEEMEREVVSINEGVLGKYHLETAKALSNLARTLRGDGRYAAAEEMEKEVVRIRIQILGLFNREVAEGMEDLCDTWIHLGQEHDRKALLMGIVTINTRALGRSAGRTISSLISLSNCLYGLGEKLESERIYKEVIQLRQSLYGRNHLTTVASTKYLARRYWEQGRYEDAKRLRMAEFDVRRSIQGLYHIDTLLAMHWVARCNLIQGQREEAAQLFNERLTLCRESLGNSHIEALNAMGWLVRTHFDLGNYRDSEILRQQELEGRRETQGSSHSDTLMTLHWLARAKLSQGRIEEATQLFKERLTICQDVYGSRHIESLNASHWLSEVHLQLECYEEAATLRQRGLELRREVHGTTHSETQRALHSLALVKVYQGQCEEAAKLLAEYLSISRELHRNCHIETLHAISLLAAVHDALDQYKELETLRKEELEGRCQIQDSSHEDILRAKHSLARAYFWQSQYAEAEKLFLEAPHGERGIMESPDGCTPLFMALIYTATDQKFMAKEAAKDAISEMRKSAESSNLEIIQFWKLLQTFSLQKLMHQAPPAPNLQR